MPDAISLEEKPGVKLTILDTSLKIVDGVTNTGFIVASAYLTDALEDSPEFS